MLRNRRGSDVSDALLERAYGEFVEMPGLQLTSVQAQRLWGLDGPTCVQLLECLVELNFLCRTQCGYARASTGRACPRTPNGKEL